MFRTRPSVLITHIYNEEYLLPWWVKHHVTMFDKGVVIDNHSTDASLDIIRTLAPHWEIVPGTEGKFDTAACDLQVMDQERRFPDHWKMVLNTTEFLCVPDMKLWLAMLEQHGWEAYGIRTAVMADPPGLYPEPPDRDAPLILQRHHGFFETEHMISLQLFFSRCRVIHRMDDGDYCIQGRHVSRHQTYIHPPGALLKYCLYSPMTPEFLARKLQMGGSMSVKETTANPANHHLLNESGQYDRYHFEAGKSVDLRQRREYANALFPWERRDDLTDTVDRYPAAPGLYFIDIEPSLPPLDKAWKAIFDKRVSHIYFRGLLSWLQTELEKRPLDSDLMYLLGAVVIKMGVGESPWEVRHKAFLKILQDMETLVVSYPTRPDLWWSLAQLRAAAGQQKEADEARRVARLLYPVLENTPDDTICVPA